MSFSLNYDQTGYVAKIGKTDYPSTDGCLLLNDWKNLAGGHWIKRSVFEQRNWNCFPFSRVLGFLDFSKDWI